MQKISAVAAHHRLHFPNVVPHASRSYSYHCGFVNKLFLCISHAHYGHSATAAAAGQRGQVTGEKEKESVKCVDFPVLANQNWALVMCVSATSVRALSPPSSLSP